MRGLVVCSLVASAIGAPGSVLAKKDPPPGTLVFVRGDTLYRAPLSDPEASEPVTELPTPAAIRAMTAAADGSALLIDFGRNALWLDMANPSLVRFIPCKAGRLSLSGKVVVCGARDRDGVVVYSMGKATTSTAGASWDPGATHLAEKDGNYLVTATDEGLVKIALSRPGKSSPVSSSGPVADLSIAPDGVRAVASYQVDGKDLQSLFTFRLTDGDARRKLVPGRPVAWSADSRWLAVNGNREGCVVRAVGGEYKCWRRYRSLALTADGSHLLLSRPSGDDDDEEAEKADSAVLDIYLGRTAGVRSSKPSRLLTGVRAATLIP